VEAIREIVTMADQFPVPIRDLYTGKIVDQFEMTSPEDIGTYVFWACLDRVISTPLDELRRASLVMVHEPGKARVVTKGVAALKIVLDTVSKMVSYPLTKLPSSAGGMGKSSHGWNLFKDFFSKEFENIMFRETSRKVSRTSEDTAEFVRSYAPRFASSTDYRNATDFLRHEVAAIIGDAWMTRCGIPPLLKGIVAAISNSPRKIYFSDQPALKSIGEEDEYGRFVLLLRGVLMGDPLTKPILHLVNIGIRQLGKFSQNREKFRAGTPGMASLHSVLSVPKAEKFEKVVYRRKSPSVPLS
jgi:hypothetical protein